MGLSASQARLLALTSRMADLEFKSEQISNQKVQLSNESSAASKAYTDALNKESLKVYSGISSDGDALYSDATAYNLTNYDPGTSISDTQRFIKNEAGELLVSKRVADAYKNCQGDSNAFVVAMGYTNVTNSELTASAKTNAVGNLENYIRNAESSISTSANYGFTTSYTDSQVLAKLDDLPGASWNLENVDSTSNLISGNEYDIPLIINNILQNAFTALTSTLKTNMGDTNFSSNNYSDSINRAMVTAYAETMTAYQQSEYEAVKNSDITSYGGLSGAQAAALMSNSVTRQDGFLFLPDTYYFNAAKLVQFFLASFDKACASISDSAGHTSQTATENSENTLTPSTVSSYNGVDLPEALPVSVLNRSNEGTGTECKANTVITTTADDFAAMISNITAEAAYINSNFGVNTGITIPSYDPNSSASLESLRTYLTSINNETFFNNLTTNVNAASVISGSSLANILTANLTASYNSAGASYYQNLFNEIKSANGGTYNANKGYKETSEENMNSSKWLQTQITNGLIYLYEYNNTTDNNDNIITRLGNVSWTSGDNTIEFESDDSTTAKAEAEFESTQSAIESKDKKFDLELKKIDTEHSAIQNEIESVKKVIEKNIENFKIFES